MADHEARVIVEADLGLARAEAGVVRVLFEDLGVALLLAHRVRRFCTGPGLASGGRFGLALPLVDRVTTGAEWYLRRRGGWLD